MSVEAFNQARLNVLSSLAGTQMKPKGVLSIDETWLTHDGPHVEKIAPLYDSTQGCDVWAHPLVHLHDRDEQTDYPVDFRLWEPVEIDALEAGLNAAGVLIREHQYALQAREPKQWRNDRRPRWRRHHPKPAVQQLYQSQVWLAQQLRTKGVADPPDRPWPVTLDNWYTQPALCPCFDKP